METNIKNTRKSIAEHTLDVLKNGFYINTKGGKVELHTAIETSIANAELIKPNDKVARGIAVQKDSTITLKNRSTLESCVEFSKDFDKIFCLNFASAKNPGGGFLGGAQAQEESLARSSALYPTIVQMQEMYQTNRANDSCFYLDYMIYSPDVPVFKDDEGILLDDYYKVSFLTYPAVNAGVVLQRESHRAGEIYEVMTHRVHRTLAFAQSKGYKCLVLGAWGCGVFQNNPNDIARIFADALSNDFKNTFERIEFAVLDRNDRGIYRAFELELQALI